MEVAQAQLLQRRDVGSKPIGGNALRLDGLVLEQPLQQLQGRIGVPPPLRHQVQDLAFVVDGAPQVPPLAPDGADHLVEMPARRWRRAAALEIAGDQLEEKSWRWTDSTTSRLHANGSGAAARAGSTSA